MKLPENVVPMPADQRARIKELAQAATPGPWVVVPAIGSPPNPDGSWPHADRAKWGQHCGVEQSDEYGREASSIFYADSPHVGAVLQDADYIAAVSPDITLATLSYVEALERELDRATRLNAILSTSNSQLRSELGEAVDHAKAGWACATKAESRAAELRGQVTSLLEDLANGCVPVQMEPGVAITPYWRGVNTERANGLKWAELKCKELGIEWPIKPIPYAGNLPSAAPTPPPSSPAAGPGETCIHECGAPVVHDGHCACYIQGNFDAQIAAGTAPGWIAVAKGLPKYKCDVAVALTDGRVIGTHCDPGFSYDEDGYTGTVPPAWGGGFYNDQVTHWHLLPIHPSGFGPNDGWIKDLIHGAESLFECPRKNEPWRAISPTEADYNASVESVAARIASREVKPIEQGDEEAGIFICSCGAELYHSESPQQCACLREHAPAAPLSASKLAAFGYEGDNSGTTTE